LRLAGQGAKHVAWPVLVGTVRLIIAGAGGWVAIEICHADLPALFAVVAASSIAFGALVALATRLQSWAEK
jgi:hydrogenase/urease accessory protein HupE